MFGVPVFPGGFSNVGVRSGCHSVPGNLHYSDDIRSADRIAHTDIYIYIHVHVCTNACVMYIRIYIYTYIHIYRYIYTHMQIEIYAHKRMSADIH